MSPSAIRSVLRKQGWATKQDGRRILVRGADVEEYAAARRRRRPAAAGDIGVAEFARRAGVNPRTVESWKAQGLIEGYNETALQEILLDRADTIDEDAQDLDEAVNLAELRRRREYWSARKMKAQALQAEGRLYEAEDVEAWASRIAQVVAAKVQDLPLRLADELAERSVAECRRMLTAWAEALLNDMARAIKGGPA